MMPASLGICRPHEHPVGARDDLETSRQSGGRSHCPSLVDRPRALLEIELVVHRARVAGPAEHALRLPDRPRLRLRLRRAFGRRGDRPRLRADPRRGGLDLGSCLGRRCPSRLRALRRPFACPAPVDWVGAGSEACSSGLAARVGPCGDHTRLNASAASATRPSSDRTTAGTRLAIDGRGGRSGTAAGAGRSSPATGAVIFSASCSSAKTGSTQGGSGNASRARRASSSSTRTSSELIGSSTTPLDATVLLPSRPREYRLARHG